MFRCMSECMSEFAYRFVQPFSKADGLKEVLGIVAQFLACVEPGLCIHI